jgi:SAM-dependent methyltransferase
MARLARHRLDAAVRTDMRALPVATGAAGGVLAFYSLIHLRRSEVAGALAELHRILRPGGRALLSLHEGDGEIEVDDFIGEAVPMAATLFQRDELVDACGSAGFEVTLAERRQPYPTEGPTVRLYLGLQRPPVDDG